MIEIDRTIYWAIWLIANIGSGIFVLVGVGVINWSDDQQRLFLVAEVVALLAVGPLVRMMQTGNLVAWLKGRPKAK